LVLLPCGAGVMLTSTSPITQTMEPINALFVSALEDSTLKEELAEELGFHLNKLNLIRFGKTGISQNTPVDQREKLLRRAHILFIILSDAFHQSGLMDISEVRHLILKSKDQNALTILIRATPCETHPLHAGLTVYPKEQPNFIAGYQNKHELYERLSAEIGIEVGNFINRFWEDQQKVLAEQVKQARNQVIKTQFETERVTLEREIALEENAFMAKKHRQEVIVRRVMSVLILLISASMAALSYQFIELGKRYDELEESAFFVAQGNKEAMEAQSGELLLRDSLGLLEKELNTRNGEIKRKQQEVEQLRAELKKKIDGE